MSILDRFTHDSTATDHPPQSEGPLAADTIHYLLRVARRRHVLDIVAGADAPIDIGDLAEHVASREYNTPVDQLDHRKRKNAYVGLHQEHLDRLAAEDVIDWDGRRVTEGPAFDQLRRAQQEIATIAADSRDEEVPADV